MVRYIKQYKFYFCKTLHSIGVLQNFNFTFTKKHGNRVFKIPVINCAGFSNLANSYEPWLDKFLKGVLNIPDAVVVDVGVNIGQTLLKIASFKDDVTYFGFEPNPTCYAYSRRLIQKNKLEKYKLFPVGLSERFQLLSLVGDNDYAGGASIIKNFRNNRDRYKNEQTVAVAEGDKALTEEAIEKIDFIKVDVEGAELEVMKGFKNTLAKYRPLVMLEILPVYNETTENGKQRKSRQEELLELMKSYGYQVFLIDEEKPSLIRISEIPVHSDMGKTNYFFIPFEREQHYLSSLVFSA